MNNAVTKPGKHGTLYLFVVEYADSADRFKIMFRDEVKLFAYNREHAELRFLESLDGEDWFVENIKLAKGAVR